MARTFDITPLRSLVAVAATGGVHKASEVLMLSQSAVTGHLRRLEAQAGATLVQRHGRHIAFTTDGEQLLAHARAILSAHDNAVAHFDRESRAVTIGGAQNSAAVVMPLLMRQLRLRGSGHDVTFVLDRNTSVREMLDDGRADIAVTTRIAPEIRPRTRGLRLEWLCAADADLRPDQGSVPLIVFSPPCTLRQPSFDAWSRASTPWYVATEINDLATGLDAVRSGAGYLLTPVMDRLPDGTRAHPTAPPTPAIQLAVVYTDRTPEHLMDSITDILSDHAGVDRVERHHHQHLAMP